MHEPIGFGQTALYVMIPIYTLSIWLMAFVSARLTWSGEGRSSSGYRSARRFSWEVEDGLGRRTREAPPVFDDVVRSSRGGRRDQREGFYRGMERGRYDEDEEDRRDAMFPLRIERESRGGESPATFRKPRAPMHAPIIGQSDRYNR